MINKQRNKSLSRSTFGRKMKKDSNSKKNGLFGRRLSEPFTFGTRSSFRMKMRGKELSSLK